MTASDDPSTAKSRSGYVILYAGCPIAWASKLQTIIALSSCEAEYVSLSESLRNTIPLMDLIKEFKEHGFSVTSTEPKVFCKAFEDNSGALELARLPKMRPRTKHINIKYHHFREHVRLGLIKISHYDKRSTCGYFYQTTCTEHLSAITKDSVALLVSMHLSSISIE